MKHIKPINEDVSAEQTGKIFKDLINWKFVNYMIDKTTVYNDEGIMNFLWIGLAGPKDWDCLPLYTVSHDHHEYSSPEYESEETLMERYDKYGIVYRITIIRNGYIEDLYKSIKNKQIQSMVLNGGDIFIKLKSEQ